MGRGAEDNLRQQAELADKLRLKKEHGPKLDGIEICDQMDVDAPANAPSVSRFSVEDILKGPAQLAFELCQAAKLNNDQARPVALLASKMQKECDEMWRQNPDLASPSSRIWDSYDGTAALLPLYGTLSRMVVIGGGGAGKSRIINLVLTPMLEAYYGPQGLMKEAPSNKAARGTNGVTVHFANNLFGNSSLLAPHLRLRPRQQNDVAHEPIGRQVVR